MGIYDSSRQYYTAQIQAESEQELLYLQKWYAEYAAQIQASDAASASRQVMLQQIHAEYGERIATVRETAAQQIAQINQRYDQDEQEYTRAMGALRETPDAGDDAIQPPAAVVSPDAPRSAPDVPDDEDMAAPEQSFLSGLLSWFS